MNRSSQPMFVRDILFVFYVATPPSVNSQKRGPEKPISLICQDKIV